MLEELFSLVKSSSISTLRSVLNERPPDIQNPLQKHAYKRKKIKTLGTLSLKPYKLFEKSLTKNFAFRKRNKSKILTTGAPLSFNYNNHLTPTHSSETPVVYASLRSVQNKRPPDVLHRTKVLCYLSFKKGSYSSSNFSTLIKACCGTSTLPICRIRFLPSFCFSSNFLFREISPP